MLSHRFSVGSETHWCRLRQLEVLVAPILVVLHDKHVVSVQELMLLLLGEGQLDPTGPLLVAHSSLLLGLRLRGIAGRLDLEGVHLRAQGQLLLKELGRLGIGPSGTTGAGIFELFLLKLVADSGHLEVPIQHSLIRFGLDHNQRLGLALSRVSLLGRGD